MTQDMKPQDVTPQTLSSQVKKGTTGSLVLGALMIVLGFAAISLPLATSLAFAFWIGWLLVGNSIVTLIYAVQTRQEGGFILKLLLFALYLGAGLLLIINPLEGVLTLTLLLGGFLIAEGVSELLLAFQLRSLSSNWGWVLLNAIVTLLIGIVILAEWPLNAPWVVGTLVGVSFIASGFSRVMLSLAVRNALGKLSESAQ
ncbi:HdeD family acid-resistance protein [Vacuolonema iberomarrocanum]|uniref:HdeD family acid-resistance protein n=1 Tax=Vacuolonema iberomarrocanum TaxID=3454632 RepID=UPI003F6E2AFA